MFHGSGETCKKRDAFNVHEDHPIHTYYPINSRRYGRGLNIVSTGKGGLEHLFAKCDAAKQSQVCYAGSYVYSTGCKIMPSHLLATICGIGTLRCGFGYGWTVQRSATYGLDRDFKVRAIPTGDSAGGYQ